MVETVSESDLEKLSDFDNRARREALRTGRKSYRTLPVIDFGPYRDGAAVAARAKVAAAIRAACLDTGFFYLINHGISEGEFQVAHALGRMFFELPTEEKAKYAKSRNPAGQGWFPWASTGSDVGPAKFPDLKESFHLTRERSPHEPERGAFSAGQSQWPDEGLCPGFKVFLQAHIAKRLSIAQALVRALALSLDLPEEYFDEAHRFPMCSLTFNYYPPCDADNVPTMQWGISPHTDYGSFTLLSQDALGGLEVRDSDGTWIDAPPMEGTFVVNVGDLLHRWTNGLYKSSLHRASNFSGTVRLSLPFFVIPHGSVEVRCLSTCVSSDNPPRYEPILAELYARTLLSDSYRTGRPAVSQQTAEERFN